MDDWKIADKPMRKNVGGVLKTYVVNVFAPDGTRSRPELGTTDPVKAVELLATWKVEGFPKHKALWEAERNLGTDNIVSFAAAQRNPTIAAIFDNYLSQEMPNKNRKPTSIHKHRQQLRDFELWLGQHRIGRAQQLSREVIKRYQADLRSRNKSIKTVHNYLTTIRACLNAAVDVDLIAQSPFRSKDLPTVPQVEKVVYSPRVISALLYMVRDHDPVIYPPVLQIATTGNRPSDVVDLLAHQVDLKAGWITRLQVKVPRLGRYAIGPEVVKSIRNLGPRLAGGHVYLDDNGKRWTVDKLYNRYVRLLAAIDFPHRITFLDLRNSYATNQANDPNDPMPVHILQAQLGHSDINTTLRYVRNSNARPYVDSMESKMRPDQWSNKQDMLAAVRKEIRGTA